MESLLCFSADPSFSNYQIRKVVLFCLYPQFFNIISSYFRQHCTMDYGGYTKDLSAVHADLSSIFILDNSPSAYRKFPREFSNLEYFRAIYVSMGITVFFKL